MAHSQHLCCWRMTVCSIAMTTEKKRTPQDADKFIVRLPSGMREHIADAAAKSHRSMNAEVIARLERTFRWDEVEHPHPAELTAEIQSSAARLQELIREFAMQQVDPDRGSSAPVEGMVDDDDIELLPTSMPERTRKPKD